MRFEEFLDDIFIFSARDRAGRIDDFSTVFEQFSSLLEHLVLEERFWARFFTTVPFIGFVVCEIDSSVRTTWDIEEDSVIHPLFEGGRRSYDSIGGFCIRKSSVSFLGSSFQKELSDFCCIDFYHFDTFFYALSFESVNKFLESNTEFFESCDATFSTEHTRHLCGFWSRSSCHIEDFLTWFELETESRDHTRETLDIDFTSPVHLKPTKSIFIVFVHIKSIFPARPDSVGECWFFEFFNDFCTRWSEIIYSKWDDISRMRPASNYFVLVICINIFKNTDEVCGERNHTSMYTKYFVYARKTRQKHIFPYIKGKYLVTKRLL